MKNIFCLSIVFLFTVGTFSQAPEKMSYQAVIRNSNGELVKSSTVWMQISILRGSETGIPVYIETQTPTTNVNGMVSVEIGGGTPITGTFAGIDWSMGSYFVKTQTVHETYDTISGTSQLLSVPYALYAKSSRTTDGTVDREYLDALNSRILALEIKAGIIDYPKNGLIAKWGFNYNLNDTVGTYNLSGSGSYIFEKGKFGKSVRIENAALLFTSALKSYYSGNLPFTISFWYKSNFLINWSSTIFSIGNYATASNAFDISIKPEYINYRRFEWGGKSANIQTSYDPYTDYYNYTDGHYHHIVATYDGTNNIFYVDGIKIGEVAQPISIGSNNTLYFGAEYPNHWPCNGNFDNAYFYNRALTFDEIKILWNNGFGL